jgi:hypothetical protein
MRRLLVLPALLLLVSCNDKTPEPDQSSMPPPASSSAARGAGSARRAPAGAGQGNLAWDVPTTWQSAENPGSMRIATYKVPRASSDEDDGEMSVAQAGGSVEQNIQRWAGQFQAKPEDVKRQERRAGWLKVTVVEIHGNYTGMATPGAPPKGPKGGYALLGAIVGTSPPTFFKLVGPEKTVIASRRDFDALVGSLHAK